MLSPSFTALLNTCRQHCLLDSGQLAELAELSIEDPHVLLLESIQRGWLTSYQADLLRSEKSDELVLGPYILKEPLGEGGMGRVFKAYDREESRFAVIKLMRKERANNPLAIRRFQREIRAAKSLSHANIILVYEGDIIGESHYLAMEYLSDSIDLDRLVRRDGPLAIEDACDYIRQAALGLQHAHEKGMVHRDIKPANLLLTADGSLIKILDLGLVRWDRASPNDNSSTITNEALGTIDYMAPEQAIHAHAVDIRADLYSLGCTFYYLLSGRVPFPGGSIIRKLRQHEISKADPIQNLRPELSQQIVAIVETLMAKRPADRYSTPLEVAEILETLPQGLANGKSTAIEICPSPVITNTLGMSLVWVRPAFFFMGAQEDEEDPCKDETLHGVTLSKGIYLGVHPVTQGEWQAVMGNNPSFFRGVKNLPVESVSWTDCEDFCKRLSEKENRSYRLPTEAEWEYACRAGTKTPYYFGSTISTSQANFHGSSLFSAAPAVYRARTTPVGCFPGNAWGLRDMHGNVWEWCQDWYGDYPENDVIDPHGPPSGRDRVVRGGSWNCLSSLCRSAYRYWGLPATRNSFFGFRICLVDDSL